MFHNLFFNPRFVCALYCTYTTTSPLSTAPPLSFAVIFYLFARVHKFFIYACWKFFYLNISFNGKDMELIVLVYLSYNRSQITYSTPILLNEKIKNLWVSSYLKSTKYQIKIVEKDAYRNQYTFINYYYFYSNFVLNWTCIFLLFW